MISRLSQVFHGRAAVRGVRAGGIGLGSARPGLTAPAGATICTCDPRFLPDAVDIDCPVDGIPGVAQVAALFAITGVCHAGQHEFCQGRVYQGHNGVRSIYRPCDCTCHAEARAA